MLCCKLLRVYQRGFPFYYYYSPESKISSIKGAHILSKGFLFISSLKPFASINGPKALHFTQSRGILLIHLYTRCHALSRLHQKSTKPLLLADSKSRGRRAGSYSNPREKCASGDYATMEGVESRPPGYLLLLPPLSPFRTTTHSVYSGCPKMNNSIL